MHHKQRVLYMIFPYIWRAVLSVSGEVNSMCYQVKDKYWEKNYFRHFKDDRYIISRWDLES